MKCSSQPFIQNKYDIEYNQIEIELEFKFTQFRSHFHILIKQFNLNRSFFKDRAKRTGNVGHGRGKLSRRRIFATRQLWRHRIATHQRTQHPVNDENRFLALSTLRFCIVVRFRTMFRFRATGFGY